MQWLYKFDIGLWIMAIVGLCGCAHSFYWQLREQKYLSFGGSHADAVPKEDFVFWWYVSTIMLFLGAAVSFVLLLYLCAKHFVN